MNDMPTLLTTNPKQMFTIFLCQCKQIENVNVNNVQKTASATLAHLRGSKITREETVIAQYLEQRWYAALKSDEGKPDWEIYATDHYLGELWACWMIYSRRYLRELCSPNSFILSKLEPINSIADLGCGFGYTTATWKQRFPEAEVFGTNIGNTPQTRLAIKIAERYGFKIVQDIASIDTKIDLIFASEYFEHIQAPTDHLKEILVKLTPKNLIIANTFTSPSPGHFFNYKIGGATMDGKRTSRIFNDTLRKYGYEKLETKFWNNRPAVWRKRKSTT